MAVPTIDDVLEIAKETYPDWESLQLQTYQDHKFLAMLPRDQRWKGTFWDIVTESAEVPAQMSAFSAGLVAADGADTFNKFQITRRREFAYWSLGVEDAMALDSSDGAITDYIKRRMGGALHVLGREMSIAVRGNGGGSRGIISATAVGPPRTITLTDRRDSVRFEVGQSYVAGVTVLDDGTLAGGGGVVFGDRVTVTGINRTTGVLTVSGAGAFPGSYVLNHHLFRCNADRSDYGTKMHGLRGWVPDAAPGATDSWFTVNRSTDVERLSGVRLATAGAKLSEEILDLMVDVEVNGGGEYDIVLSHPNRIAQLAKLMQDQIHIGEVKTDKGFNFSVNFFIGPNGNEVKLIGDRDFDNAHVYVGTLATAKMKSLGAFPQKMRYDGLEMIRASDSHSVSGYVWGSGNFGISDPRGWGVLTL